LGEHEGGRAIRAGNWKLSALREQPWELFDMAGDKTETRNLSGIYPEIVEGLDMAWKSWATGPQNRNNP